MNTYTQPHPTDPDDVAPVGTPDPRHRSTYPRIVDTTKAANSRLPITRQPSSSVMLGRVVVAVTVVVVGIALWSLAHTLDAPAHLSAVAR